MALTRYVFTQTYTMQPGTITPGNAGSEASSTDSLFGLTWVKGQAIELDADTPSALYTALNTAGVIRPWVPGDDVGHGALSN